jgi:hypothetical protein
MREPSRLSRSAINGNTNIDHIADAAEEVVEIAVSHLEGHVADEKGLGGRILRLAGAVGAGFQLRGLEGGILDGKAAAFEELLMQGFDGFRGRFGGFEVDIAESKGAVRVWMECFFRDTENLPFA